MDTQEADRTTDAQVGAEAVPRGARAGVPRAAVAGGLAVVGVAGLLVAAWLPVAPARDARPAGMLVLVVVTVAALSGAVYATARDVARGQRVALCLLTAGLAVLGAVLAGRALADDVAGGVPTRVFPLLAGGHVAVLAAALLLLGTPVRRGGRRRAAPGARSALAGAGAAVLVAALLLGASELVVRAPVQASTAGPAAGGSGVVAPTEVRWSHQLAGGQQVRSGGVVAAGSGAVVLVDDGVTALDGVTGEVRWEHRRTGARATQVAAGAGGEHVVVVFRSGAEAPRSSRLVVLDGRTGAVTADWVDERDVASGSYRLDLTGRVLVSTGRESVTGRSLADRSVSWTWRAPVGCRLVRGDSGYSGVAAGVDTVLASCTVVEPGGGVLLRVLGLDDRTGAQRWVHEDRVEVPAELPGRPGQRAAELDTPVLLDSSGNGTAVRLRWNALDDDDVLDRVVVLAVDDGRVLTGDAALGVDPQVQTFDERATVTWRTGPGPVGYTRVPADGSPARTVPQSGDCLTDGVADVGGALVQLCHPDDTGVSDVWVTPWDGSAVRRVPVDLEPVAGELVADDLLRLPGVLVVAVPGTTRVVGLG